MQNSLGIATLSEVASPISDDNLHTLRNELRQGYLLDFKTTKWELRYDHYDDYAYVVYQGRARLVNIPEEKVLWQGVCDLHEEDTKGKPSTEDFEANNGTLLKDYLARLATSCTAEFHKQLVGTQAPQ